MERTPSATQATDSGLSELLAAHVKALDGVDSFTTHALLKENAYERTELVQSCEGMLFVRKTLHCDPKVSSALTEKTAGGFPGKYNAACGVDLRHPYERLAGHTIKHLPHVYQALRFGDDLLVLIEYVEGKDLRQYVIEKDLLGFQEALKVAADLTSALESLHSFEGGPIIHRDVNPGNIVITSAHPCDVVAAHAEEGLKHEAPENQTRNRTNVSCETFYNHFPERASNIEAFLIDLGIARSWNEEARKDTRIWGTTGYTAPEQFGFRQTDARADEYSLAATIGFMLTGQEGGDFLETDALSQLPADVANVLRRGLSLDPDNRFATVREFFEALESCNTVDNSPSAASNVHCAPAKRVVSVPTSQTIPQAASVPPETQNVKVHSATQKEPAPQARPNQSRQPGASSVDRRNRAGRTLWRVWQIAVFAIAGTLAVIMFVSSFVLVPLGYAENGKITQFDTAMIIVFWFAIPSVVLANPAGITSEIPWLTRWRYPKLAGILALSILIPPFVSALVGAAV